MGKGCQHPARPDIRHPRVVLTRNEINSARSVVRWFRIGSDLNIPGPPSSVGEAACADCISANDLNGSVAGIVGSTISEVKERGGCIVR